MKPMDRRSFLLGAFTYLKADEAPAAEPNPVSRIGRIADFPLGVETRVRSGSILVESLPEGLRARSVENADRYYAIGIDPDGEIKLNLEEIWPSSRVFSILTCEPTNL